MQRKRTAVALAFFVGIFTLQLMAQERGERVEAERIIDGPRIEQVTHDGATIAWTTNTGGSSVIRYGTNPEHLDRTAESPYADNDRNPRYQTHRVELRNLRPDTTYYYRVVSGQGEGTGTEAHSRVEEFRTR
jgi:hypothetical protein